MRIVGKSRVASFEHDDRQVGDTKILSQRDFGTVLLWRLLCLHSSPRLLGFSPTLIASFPSSIPLRTASFPSFHILLPSVYCGLQGITTVLQTFSLDLEA